MDRFVGSEFPDFRTLLERRQFWLGGMGEDDLREVMVRPAARCGAYFEKGLVERLLKQMHEQASALPLLEEALNSLWDKRRGCWLTHQSLDEIGGVGGALAEKAESIFNRLSDSEQAIARRVFLKLIQLGEGTRDTRRRVAIANLQSVNDNAAEFETVLHRFSTVGSRLITFSSEPDVNREGEAPAEPDTDREGEAPAEPRSAETPSAQQELRPPSTRQPAETAEVTHEALIDHWRRLSGWLDECRDDIRLERRLENDARRWADRAKPDGILWRPPDLDLARDYVHRVDGSLPSLQYDFYTRSDGAGQRRIAEEEQQRQREIQHAKERTAAAKRFRTIATIATLVAVFAIGIGIYAVVQRQQLEAETARTTAVAIMASLRSDTDHPNSDE